MRKNEDVPMGMRTGPTMAVEFVSPGHPDKVCDQIADAIVDAALSKDPLSRVAMEVTGGHFGLAVIGEMTTRSRFDIADVAKATYRDIGHDHALGVFVNVVKQASNIKRGVDIGGAGDQGVMTGYAIWNPDGNHMPPLYMMARKLLVRLGELRQDGTLPYAKPDGKSQVSLVNGEVTHVTLAAHHDKDVTLAQLQEDLLAKVILPVIPATSPVAKNPVIFDREKFRQTGVSGNVVINGTGVFIQGGFDADAGTTGRKLMIDSYGPNMEVGGGCFSGKDPTKVDRSGAYFCRFVAKSIVASRIAPEAIVKVAYAIGVPTPTFISVQTPLSPDENKLLTERIKEQFDFSPKAIIERLGLQRPNGWCYRCTAASGHFTNPAFPWEQPAQVT